MDKEELLFKHFAGTLTYLERQYLEEMIVKDPSWKKSFEANKFVRAAVDYTRNSDLRTRMKQWDEKDKKKVFTLRRLIPFGIAASLFIALGFYVNAKRANYSNEALFTAYYQPDFQFQRGDSAGESIFSEAESIILKKLESRLPGIIEELEKIPLEDEYYGYSRYLLGHAHLNLGNSTLAIKEWETVIKIGDPKKEDAEWFIVLAYLQAGDTKSAKSRLLLIVSDSNHSFFTQGKKLLEEERSFWRWGIK